ncbi:MAG: response regulator [Acetivibrio sp.]
MKNFTKSEGKCHTLRAEENIDGNKCFFGSQILLVDDTKFNMEVTQDLLELVGCNVECAVNGKEAIDKFTQSPPHTYDIILMDVQMPVLNGLEAAKAIRASSHEDSKTIPILAMTANTFLKDINDSFSAGMNDHLTKPIDSEVLYQTLRKYLQKA